MKSLVINIATNLFQYFISILWEISYKMISVQLFELICTSDDEKCDKTGNIILSFLMRFYFGFENMAEL